MRKEIFYFDMDKIAFHRESLLPSELEVESYLNKLAPDPKPGLYLRLDLEEALKKLTPRQRQVVDLLANGYTEREIADRLGISPPAVHHLLDKARVILKKFLGGG